MLDRTGCNRGLDLTEHGTGPVDPGGCRQAGSKSRRPFGGPDHGTLARFLHSARDDAGQCWSPKWLEECARHRNSLERSSLTCLQTLGLLPLLISLVLLPAAAQDVGTPPPATNLQPQITSPTPVNPTPPPSPGGLPPGDFFSLGQPLAPVGNALARLGIYFKGFFESTLYGVPSGGVDAVPWCTRRRSSARIWICRRWSASPDRSFISASTRASAASPGGQQLQRERRRLLAGRGTR